MRISLPKHLIAGLLLLFTFSTNSMSQAIWELGIKGGTSFYLGDLSSTIFPDFQPAGGAYIRYNFNPRYSLTSILEATQFTTPMEKKLVDGTVQLEFNFFEYGLMNSSSWTRFLSPYIFAGVSVATYRDLKDEMTVNPNFPFGLGLKWKARPHLNIGLEWSMHKLFNDKLDLVDDPYKINSFGLMNNDWYSMFTLFVGFDLGNRSSYCR